LRCATCPRRHEHPSIEKLVGQLKPETLRNL
jgi:hypothetical protein